MPSVLASGRAGGNAFPVNTTLPAGVLPDDELVLLTFYVPSSGAAVPTGATANGVAMTQRHASQRGSVWTLRGLSSGALTIAITSSNNPAYAWFLVRDVAAVYDAETVQYIGPTGGTSSAPPIASTPVTVGATQLILALGTPADTMASAGSLPSPGSWTMAQAGTTKTAHAVPATADVYSVEATRGIVGANTAKGIVRVVVGTPPPGPPVNVAVTPSQESLTVTWDAPTTGGITTGYDARLDLGDPFPVLVPGIVFGGLTPDTGYAVQVRATGPAGVSDWVTVATATLAPVVPTEGSWYRATVTVGGHTWTAEAGDAAVLGPILPLELGWELPEDAPGIPAQPGPDTCALSLVTAEAMPDVATGTPARVTVWLDDTPGARPYATMAGEVGDLEVFPQALPNGGHGVRTRMLLVGHETAANAYRVGSQPWPAESGDARAGRIMAEAGQLPWSVAIPVGNTFAERPARDTPKGDALTEALTEAAVYVAGDYSPPARHLWRATADELGNRTGYTADLVPAETDAIDVLDGAWVNRAASWRRTRRRDGAWVQVTHPGGVTVYGRPEGPPLPPVTLQVTDPDPYADLLLSTLYTDAWVSGEWFRVHLHAGAPITYGLDWFRRDELSPGFPWATRVVVVENIQVLPGLFTRYGGMLAGARLVIEPGGRLMLLFRLRPDVPAWSVVTPRWMDEDPADLWTDEDPDATWAELRTTPREDA